MAFSSSLLASIVMITGVCAGTSSTPDLVHDYDSYNAGDYGIIPNRTYVSSNLTSPAWQVNTWNSDKIDQSPKHIFMDFAGVGEDAGPKILNTKDLSLVYSHPADQASFNARVQRYNNTNYLTYWAGSNTGDAGSGTGYCYFLNNKYELEYTIAPVGLPGSLMTDQHECQMTADDTVLITVYRSIPGYDLTSVGGPANGTLLDSGFQEIDIASNTSAFTWWASEHFDISNTYVSYADAPAGQGPRGFDFFHLNSIQKVGQDFVVSGRLCNIVTYINHTDGTPIWTLGGRLNQFKDLSNGNALSFAFQHHARIHDSSLSQLTMFDNHGYNTSEGCRSNCSRGLYLDLNTQDKTVKVNSQFYHPQSLATGAEGSFEFLENGNALIGWGVNPTIIEATSAGEVVMDVQYAPWSTAGNLTEDNANYRVFKDTWVAYPTWDPAIATKNGKAYVSWNGATEVESWAVYTGDSANRLGMPQTLPKDGFETVIKLGTAKFVQVKGLDKYNKVLGATEVVEVR